MRSAEPALRHDGRGDLPAGPDVVCGLAGRLPGDTGQERAGGGADEAPQTGPRGETCRAVSSIFSPLTGTCCAALVHIKRVQLVLARCT